MNRRKTRHIHIRKKIVGTSARPRLAVFRSNQHIYAQVIDDSASETLVAESDLDLKKGTEAKQNKASRAFEVGKKLAKKAVAKGIKSVVFDRGGFLYHGRIAKLAEGVREGGLKF